MPTRRAWLLALGAIGIRAVAALGVATLHSDAARNLRMADLINLGQFRESLLVRHSTPPLHPLLTALLDPNGNRLLLTGNLVSMLLGGLSLLPLYWLARRLWDDRVATIAASLYALLPAIVDLHCEATTEATFMFFFLTSMAVGWSALEERSWERTIVAALCAALAWLTRPEGIYLVPLFFAAALLRPHRFSAAAVAIFSVVWLVAAFPYLCFIHAETGHWRSSLSAIPDAIKATLLNGPTTLPRWDPEEARALERHGGVLGTASILAQSLFAKVLFYVLPPFLLLGFIRLRPGEGGRRLLSWILLAALVYLIPVVLAFRAAMPFSFRFLLLPAALLLPVVARGILLTAERTKFRYALPILVGVLLLPMLVRDLRSRRSDRVGLKEAGEAILRDLGPRRRVYATDTQIEFYARSTYQPWPELARFVDVAHADAFAFGPGDPRRLEPGLEDRIRALHEFLGEFHSVRVYRQKQP